MKPIRIICLPVLLSFFLQNTFAQNKEVRFNLVTGSNGQPLTDGNINAITQDSYGYMWFTVQGPGYICRYDGNHVVNFKHEKGVENSPGRTEPETIYGDRDGMVWIGYFNGDLDRYNTTTGIFTHYKNNPKDPSSLSAGMVSVIIKDHQGNLWVGTKNGLDRLDEKTGQFKHYRNDPANPASLSCNTVRSICVDHEGVLWVGTGYEFNPDSSGGLNRMNPDETFTRFLHDPKNPNSLINNKVRVLFEDSHGILWIGTSGDGLYTMNREKTAFERHAWDPKKPEQLSRPALNAGSFYDPITFIREDGNGDIWIGTLASGVNRYDTVTKKITHYQSGNGFREKGAWAAFKSRDGVFWLAATEGNPFLYKAEAPVNKMKYTETGGMTVSFQDSRSSGVWVSVFGKGLLHYDQQMKLIHVYDDVIVDSVNLLKTNIFSIYQDNPDTLWLCTTDGLMIFNIKTGRFARLTYRDSSGSLPKKFAEVLGIVRNKNGNIWLATEANGIIAYNPGNGLIKNYIPYPQDNQKKHNAVMNILEGDSGNIWAASSYLNYATMDQGIGITRFNAEKENFTYFLDGTASTALFRDSKGVLWAGTANGLYRYHPQTDSFSPFFDEESGLRGIWIYKITEDRAGNLWALGKSVFVKINADRSRQFIYGKKYGIQEESLLFGGLAETSSGLMLVGTRNGFYSFLPEEMFSENKTLNIAISEFYINNRQIFLDVNGILKKPIEKTEKIELKYNQNNFDFRVSVFDYRNPEANRVYTMLENFDNAWRENSGDKNVRFLNVPPGNYYFKVRASNEDGVQAEKSIHIIIHPPWWKTGWAYAFYALMLLIVSVLMNRFLRQRAISHERQKAQVKELAQAREIEKAYTELKNTQAQLIQSEKMASLGELTAGIAHEIQNPLNFVNNFSDVNAELLTEMDDEIEKGNLEEVRSLAKNIRENEEKIIQHGKRADSIVKGMLQHSRTSVGQKEPVDINALADEYLRLSFHGLRAKDKLFQAAIKTDFDGSLGKINMVPQEIGRVLLNLYNNAFYAVYEKSKQGLAGYEPLVTVQTKRKTDQAEIIVRDNGSGISARALDKIFQPFFTTKPAGSGTGLGLSLSYDIIKAHGGEIKVTTSENEFTEFHIMLPFSPA